MANIKKWDEVINSISAKTNKRSKKTESDPFDIFPEWFKSPLQSQMDKDKKTVKQNDGYTTGVENYLAKKKAHRRITPTTYNKEYYKHQSKFSSPDAEQEINAPTNMGGYEELEMSGIEYNDPIISTKPTPTSRKLGVARPGPSTFIQTAKYNPTTKQLNVQYTDGKIFPYQNVSMELADRILKKRAYHSPGQTMLNTIFRGHGTTRADEIADINEGM